jgi:hypothetical protein
MEIYLKSQVINQNIMKKRPIPLDRLIVYKLIEVLVNMPFSFVLE